MSKNIVLCGVGGQGTILASRLIAAAAMKKGIPVKTAETIGMAQRGGSVFSHLRIGEGAGSPMVGKGKADLIIAFEPAEAVRQLPFLKKGGSVVVSKRPVMPVSAMIGASRYDVNKILDYLRANVANLTEIDGDKAAEELGSSKVLNVLLLGAAAQMGALPFGKDELLQAIRTLVKPRLVEMNEKALELGMSLA